MSTNLESFRSLPGVLDHHVRPGLDPVVNRGVCGPATPARKGFALILRFLTAVTLGASAGSAYAEATAGRKESRGRIAYDAILKEAVETLQKEQGKKGKLGEKLGVDLHKGVQNVYSMSTTVGDVAPSEAQLPSYAAFKASLPTISLYEMPDGTPQLAEVPGATRVTYSIVENDVILSDLELRFFYQQSVALKKGSIATQQSLFAHAFTSANGMSTAAQGSLRGMTESGRIVRWTPGSTLTYCVLKWTFGNDVGRYNAICEKMKAAAEAWSAACNIKFSHRSDLDTVPKNTTFPVDAHNRRQVLFVVAQYSALDAVASAFFPNDSVDDRLLLINPSQFYGGKFSETGVLRHELGHVLGFRHEHISPNAPVWASSFCNQESAANSTPIRLPYDRHSVMHYPCASRDSHAPAANWAMELTQTDIDGARYVYGASDGTTPPADATMFKDFAPTP